MFCILGFGLCYKLGEWPWIWYGKSLKCESMSVCLWGGIRRRRRVCHNSPQDRNNPKQQYEGSLGTWTSHRRRESSPHWGVVLKFPRACSEEPLKHPIKGSVPKWAQKVSLQVHRQQWWEKSFANYLLCRKDGSYREFRVNDSIRGKD